MSGRPPSGSSADASAERLFRACDVAADDLLDLASAAGLDAPGSPVAEPILYWERPSEAEGWLAVGAVAAITAAGPDRMRIVRRRVRELLANAMPEAGHVVAPRVVGGFGFAPEPPGSRRWREFPAAWFILPRKLWIRRGRRVTLIECTSPGPDVRCGSLPLPAREGCNDEDRIDWSRRVRRVLDEIDSGRLEKVVLSRTRTRDPLPVSLLEVLRRLRAARTECVTFAFKPGETTFFGSTPELMVERQAGRFVCPALAGTSARGTDEASDRARARALLASEKNRREHQAVVAGIRAALKPFAVRIEAEPEPHVIRLPEALHLRTPISGRGAEDLDVLALASALHPTPAVCGTPRAAAAAWLREHEPDRGWYTGGIGWMDAAGDGEMVVALRSALVADNRLHLFAGAGIVAGSDPDDEFRETAQKMEAVRVSLDGANATLPRPQAVGT